MQRIISAVDFNIDNGYYAVKFGAVWCAPCKKLEPSFNKMAIEFSNINFMSIDIDDVPVLAQRFEIRTVPTILLIKNGFVKKRIPGLVLIEPLRKAFRDLVAESRENHIAESCVA